jgi:hypothetical protein
MAEQQRKIINMVCVYVDGKITIVKMLLVFDLCSLKPDVEICMDPHCNIMGGGSRGPDVPICYLGSDLA